jgi:hypothetical protein
MCSNIWDLTKTGGFLKELCNKSQILKHCEYMVPLTEISSSRKQHNLRYVGANNELLIFNYITEGKALKKLGAYPISGYNINAWEEEDGNFGMRQEGP